MKYATFKKIIATIFTIIGATGTVFAIAQTYEPNDTVTIGEYLFEDDFSPSLDDCFLTVKDPNGLTIINSVTMTVDSSGWHHYNTTAPSTEGEYPAVIECGTLGAGNLIKTSKSFIVKVPSLTNAGIANAVWAYSTRTLTSLSSVAADVWNAAYTGTRRLTDTILTGGGSIALTSEVDAAQNAIVSEVLTNRSLINGLNNISAADVWGYGTRSTNAGSVDLSSGTIQSLWNTASSGLNTSGSIGKRIVDNLDAQVSSRGTSTLTAADVWNSATRTLSDYATNDIATSIWSHGSRTLSSYGNDITAADVWNVLATSINTAGSIGKQLVDNVDQPLSVILTQVQNNETLINGLNNISAADVWGYGTRSTNSGSVDLSSASIQSIWDKASSSLNASGSIGKRIVDNLDAQVSSRGTSTLTAADVWNSATRTLSDYATNDIAQAVWINATRTLSSYGNDITAADVWNVLSSSLNTTGSIGKQITTNVDDSLSNIISEIQTNRSLINSLNNISAADVWGYGTRSTNAGSVDLSSGSRDAIWNVAAMNLVASGSIGKRIVDNLDAQVSSRGTSTLTAADVWNSATRTLSDYAESSISAAVWANATRTLSNYGNDITAADVWNVLSSSLVTIGSVGEQVVSNIDAPVSAIGGTTNWSVKMANIERVQTGYVYRTKVFVLNSSAQPTNPYVAPYIKLYDSSRNIVVSNVSMTQVSTGVYEYTYTVAPNAAQGVWETIAYTEVESGKVIQTNDYWEAAGSPAQVIIYSVNGTNPSSVSANITITNEGLAAYEYQYEWCIVSQVNNNCGGGDDVFHAMAAKFINPGDSWNTNLTGNVPSSGTYYFKLVVYFGTDSSVASRVFTAVNNSSGGGGGGGGGSSSLPAVATRDTCNLSADFNQDCKVNSVDFSILLAYWKTKSPFKNPRVDINKDNQVNSIDFSILLFQWSIK